MFKEFTTTSVVYSFSIIDKDTKETKKVTQKFIWNPVLTEKQVKGLVEKFSKLIEQSPYDVKALLTERKYLTTMKWMVNDTMSNAIDELDLPTLVDEDEDNPL